MKGLLDAFDASMLTAVTNGCLRGSPDARIVRARANSQLCREGDLFVAMAGKHLDGSQFAESAWNNGAEVVLAANNAEVPKPPPGKALVLVDDVQASLLKVASARRKAAKKLDVVGITGSNGKTTTKDILAAIMAAWLGEKVLATQGNYNSDIGLPLTLVDLRSVHQLAVLEMGMNRVGEMALLADLARPRVGIITNIGTAHIGEVGSREAIACEKKAIFNSALPSSVAVVGADDPWREVLVSDFPGEVRLFGRWGEKGWTSFEDRGTEGFLIKRDGADVRFVLPGRHNLLNAMAAVEAAAALDAPESAIRTGLESVRPASGRCEIVSGEITVVRDCYNANPESLNAALEFFKGLTFSGRHIVVLGEMLELGIETVPALKAAGKVVADSGVDAVFFFGNSLGAAEEALLAKGYMGYIKRCTDIEKLRGELSDYTKPGDGVLLKGSRGNALERLNDVLV